MVQQSHSKRMTRIDVIIVVCTCVFVFLLMLGIVLPALYKARNTSYRTKCGYNLSAIGKAMQMYAKDYDGVFPRAGGESSA
jgi:ABC-type Fe3+ transport system permease subunit